MVSPASSELVIATWVISSPVIGDETASPSRAGAVLGIPSRDRMASASSRIEVRWVGKMFIMVVGRGKEGATVVPDLRDTDHDDILHAALKIRFYLGTLR
jgi:hypothetical protein